MDFVENAGGTPYRLNVSFVGNVGDTTLLSEEILKLLSYELLF